MTAQSFACRCVEWQTDVGTIRAKKWRRNGAVVVATGVSISHSTERVYARRWQVALNEEAAHEVDRPLLVRESRRLQTMGARKIAMTSSQKLGVEAPAWYADAPEDAEESGRCGSPVSVVGAPTVSASITASSATWDGEAWGVAGLQLEGELPYLADFSAAQPGPVSGWLPPTIVYSDEIPSVEASYLLASLGVAPQVVVAPSYWYGAGFGVMSGVEPSSAGVPALAEATDLLDVQLRWSEQAGDVRPYSLGDGFWGTPYTHMTASIEEVGDTTFWQTARIERDALFRPWRFSRAGIALSGPQHVFQVRLIHPEPSAQLDARPDAVGANLHLATSHALGEAGRFDFEARHVSFLVQGDGLHSTLLRAGADRVFGSRGAIYLRPALRTWLQTGLGGQGAGIGTATSGQLVASADAGVSLRGRFDGASHRVEPGVVVAREVVGFSRADADVDPLAGLVPGRESQWTLAGVRLDQGFDIGPNLAVDLPLALFYEGSGFEETFEERPWLLGGATLRASRFDVAARAACPDLCDEVLWSASAAAEIGAFESLYMAGDLNTTLLRPLEWRASIDDGGAFLHGFQQVGRLETLSESGLTHLAQIGWGYGRFGAQLQGYYLPETDDAGLGIGNSYAFPELGWSVGLRALVGGEEWGVMLGLGPS